MTPAIRLTLLYSCPGPPYQSTPFPNLRQLADRLSPKGGVAPNPLKGA